MNDKFKLIEEIKDLHLFDSLDKTSLEEISEKFELVNYQMGETILLEDKIPNFFYIILEGEVRQLVENPLNKRTVTLATYQKGYLIGWSSFECQKPIEFITAATDCKLLKVSKGNFINITERYNTVLSAINQHTFPSVIWEFLKLKKDLKYPDKAKDFRYWIKRITSQTKIILCDSNSKWDDFSDNKINWFLASNLDKFKIGKLLNKNNFSEVYETEKLPFKILGLLKSLFYEDIDQEASDMNLLLTNQIQIKEKSEKENQQVKKKTKQKLIDDETNGEDSFEKNYSSKYSFYSSANDYISEAVACFRIIGDTLDVPLKTDLIRRAFVEVTKNNEIAVNMKICAEISESLGLQSQLLEIPMMIIKRLKLPALIRLKNDELCILHAYKKEYLLLARPKIGLKKYKFSELKELASDENKIPALTLTRTDKTPRKRLSFKWFLPAIKKNKKSLIEVLIASLFVQLFQLMNPLIIQQIIDKVIGQGARSSLLPLVVLLFFFSFFENLLTALRTNLFIDTTNRIDMSLGEQVIDHLLRLPLPYFDKRKVGELSSRVGELEQIRSFLTGTALTVVIDAIFSFVYIGVMLLYSWVLTIVSLLVAPILAVITFLVAPVIRNQLRSKAELNAKTQNHLVEILTGIQTVKAQNFEHKARWKWKERYSKYISESFRNAVTSTTSNSLTQFLNQASNLIVLCLGSYLVLRGDLTLGQLIAFRIISGYVTTPILRLSNLYQNFQQTNISLERLSDIIDTPQESSDEDKLNIPMPEISGLIKFEKVSFGFSKKKPLNLINISMEAEQGKFVAIVGQSGSGKSTLTKLIPRLYEPTSGKIYIDNIDISKVELYSLRRQIGIVPQDSILFDGTIQENISLTNPDATVEEIVKAAKIANAHDFIMGSSQGYASKVGERGSNLSGGQRQRIAIARSILQNPKMLIMDESTSALDFETERRVSLNLMEYFRGRTVFFITHRLNSIIHADKIIMLHDGRVEEQGTHNELLELKGRYYSLFKQQDKDIDI